MRLALLAPAAFLSLLACLPVYSAEYSKAVSLTTSSTISYGPIYAKADTYVMMFADPSLAYSITVLAYADDSKWYPVSNRSTAAPVAAPVAAPIATPIAAPVAPPSPPSSDAVKASLAECFQYSASTLYCYSFIDTGYTVLQIQVESPLGFPVTANFSYEDACGCGPRGICSRDGSCVCSGNFFGSACTTCRPPWVGAYCTETCQHGTWDSGHCTCSQATGWAGEACNHCDPELGYVGATCDKRMNPVTSLHSVQLPRYGAPTNLFSTVLDVVPNSQLELRVLLTDYFGISKSIEVDKLSVFVEFSNADGSLASKVTCLFPEATAACVLRVPDAYGVQIVMTYPMPISVDFLLYMFTSCNCSDHGRCPMGQLGSCMCSDDYYFGHWQAGSNCSTCSPGFSGGNCVTDLFPRNTRSTGTVYASAGAVLYTSVDVSASSRFNLSFSGTAGDVVLNLAFEKACPSPDEFRCDNNTCVALTVPCAAPFRCRGRIMCPHSEVCALSAEDCPSSCAANEVLCPGDGECVAESVSCPTDSCEITGRRTCYVSGKVFCVPLSEFCPCSEDAPFQCPTSGQCIPNGGKCTNGCPDTLLLCVIDGTCATGKASCPLGLGVSCPREQTVCVKIATMEWLCSSDGTCPSGYCVSSGICAIGNAYGCLSGTVCMPVLSLPGAARPLPVQQHKFESLSTTSTTRSELQLWSASSLYEAFDDSSCSFQSSGTRAVMTCQSVSVPSTAGRAWVRLSSLTASQFELVLDYVPRERVSNSGCEQSSTNGYWAGPYCSQCSPGYSGIRCTEFTSCADLPCLNGGVCTNGLCACPSGWYGSQCETQCQVGGPSCRNGTCDSVGTCSCHPGFDGVNCDTCSSDFYGPNCDQICNCFHGTCDETGSCVCQAITQFGAWSGPDCSECADGYSGLSCLITCSCNTAGTQGCQPDGSGCSCHSDGTCECKNDYFGDRCDVYCKRNETCNNHGSCSGSGNCVCDADALLGYWKGEGCNECDEGFWCSDCLCECACSLHGTCNSTTGACKCFNSETDGHWAGSECDICASGWTGDSCTVPTDDVSGSLRIFSRLDVAPVVQTLESTSVLFSMNLADPYLFYIRGLSLTIWPNWTAPVEPAKDISVMCHLSERDHGSASVTMASVSGTVVALVVNFVKSINMPPRLVVVDGSYLVSPSCCANPYTEIFSFPPESTVLALTPAPTGLGFLAFYSFYNQTFAQAIYSNLSAYGVLYKFPFVTLTSVAPLPGHSLPWVFVGAKNQDSGVHVIRLLPPLTATGSFTEVDQIDLDLCQMEECVEITSMKAGDGDSVVLAVDVSHVSKQVALVVLDGLDGAEVKESSVKLSGLHAETLAVDVPTKAAYISVTTPRATDSSSTLPAPSTLYQISLSSLSVLGSVSLMPSVSGRYHEAALTVEVEPNTRILALGVVAHQMRVVFVNLFRVTGVTVEGQDTTIFDSRGGVTVTIRGSGFVNASAWCSFNSFASSSAAVYDTIWGWYTCPFSPLSSSDELCTTIPVELALFSKSRVTSDRIQARVANSPVITKIDPQGGIVGSDVTVTIEGAGFLATTRCYFGTESVIPSSIESSRILCPWQPSQPNGTDTLVLVSLDGYVFVAAPTTFATIGFPAKVRLPDPFPWSGTIGADLAVHLSTVVLTVTDSFDHKVTSWYKQFQDIHQITISALLTAEDFGLVDVPSAEWADGIPFTGITLTRPLVGQHLVSITVLGLVAPFIFGFEITIEPGAAVGVEWVDPPAGFIDGVQKLSTIHNSESVTFAVRDSVGNALPFESLEFNNVVEWVKPAPLFSSLNIQPGKDSLSLDGLLVGTDGQNYALSVAFRTKTGGGGANVPGGPLTYQFRAVDCRQFEAEDEPISILEPESEKITELVSQQITETVFRLRGWKFDAFGRTSNYTCRLITALPDSSSTGSELSGTLRTAQQWQDAARRTTGNFYETLLPGEPEDTCTLACALPASGLPTGKGPSKVNGRFDPLSGILEFFEGTGAPGSGGDAMQLPRSRKSWASTVIRRLGPPIKAHIFTRRSEQTEWYNFDNTVPLSSRAVFERLPNDPSGSYAVYLQAPISLIADSIDLRLPSLFIVHLDEADNWIQSYNPFANTGWNIPSSSTNDKLMPACNQSVNGISEITSTVELRNKAGAVMATIYPVSSSSGVIVFPSLCWPSTPKTGAYTLHFTPYGSSMYSASLPVTVTEGQPAMLLDTASPYSRSCATYKQLAVPLILTLADAAENSVLDYIKSHVVRLTITNVTVSQPGKSPSAVHLGQALLSSAQTDIALDDQASGSFSLGFTDQVGPVGTQAVVRVVALSSGNDFLMSPAGTPITWESATISIANCSCLSGICITPAFGLADEPVTITVKGSFDAYATGTVGCVLKSGSSSNVLVSNLVDICTLLCYFDPLNSVSNPNRWQAQGVVPTKDLELAVWTNSGDLGSAKFSLKGSPTQLYGYWGNDTTTTVTYQSQRIVALPALTVDVRDAAGNSLVNSGVVSSLIDGVNVTLFVSNSSVAQFFSPQNMWNRTTDGTAKFIGITLNAPLTGTYNLSVSHSLGILSTTTVSVEIIPGDPHRLHSSLDSYSSLVLSNGEPVTISVTTTDVAGNQVYNSETTSVTASIHPENKGGLGDVTYATMTGGVYTLKPSITGGRHGIAYRLVFRLNGATNVSTLELPFTMHSCASTQYAVNDSTDCRDCPDGGKCNGSTYVAVQTGYWRAYSSCVEKEYCFVSCIYTANCLGTTFLSLASTVSVVKDVACREGTTGPLCSVCVSGYGKSGQKCNKCPDAGQNAVLLILLLIALLAVVVVMVLTNLTGKQKSPNKLAIMIKTILNYLQVSSLTAEISIPWEDTLVRFFRVQSRASGPTTSFVSFTCLSSLNQYQLFVGWMLLPAMIMVVPAIVCLLIHLRRRLKGIHQAQEIIPEAEPSVNVSARMQSEHALVYPMPSAADNHVEAYGGGGHGGGGIPGSLPSPQKRQDTMVASMDVPPPVTTFSSVVMKKSIQYSNSGRIPLEPSGENNPAPFLGAGVAQPPESFVHCMNESAENTARVADPHLHLNGSDDESDDGHQLLDTCALCKLEFAIYICSRCRRKYCDLCDTMFHEARRGHHRKMIDFSQLDRARLTEGYLHSAKDIYIVAVLVLLFLAFPSLVTQVAALLSCTQFEGPTGLDKRLTADMTLSCLSSEYRHWQAASVAFTVIYGLGIPFFGFLVLWNNRDKLGHSRVMLRLGFITTGYRKQAFFWEMVILTRKMVLVIVIATLESASPRYTAFVAMWVVVLYLALNIYFQPFKFVMLWRLENLSLATIAITLNIGVLYFDDTLDSRIRNGLMWVVFALQVLVTVLFGLMFFYELRRFLRTVLGKEPTEPLTVQDVWGFAKHYVHFLLGNRQAATPQDQPNQQPHKRESQTQTPLLVKSQNTAIQPEHPT
eukprot:TRINITY_DN2683_c0_g1_i1.p1 TRINITY_DN2683_c0_g1~~TRINITY_DN2683_c0_g1_i1.p1  ORF type:complete len:3424 (-),score=286.53 TRINITY_DN2683_c0_g1_i1:13-10251(-)